MRFRYRGVEFGGLGDILVTEFDPGTASLRTQDTDRPQSDGVIPGREFFGGRTWAFDLVTNRQDLTGALATAAALEAAWVDPSVRLKPFLKMPLSYELNGRWRRVYGRPDKFAGPKGDVRAKVGGAPLTADFRVMDPLYYDEDESTLRLTIVPASVGGLTSPLISPITSVRSGEPRAGLITNGGNAPTPLMAKFNGPITNPVVRSESGWEIGLVGTLAYDQSVLVDPLNGTVTRQDGAPVGGMLTNASRLSAVRLPVGPSSLIFGGTDPTGTATVDLFWRSASTSI